MGTGPEDVDALTLNPEPYTLKRLIATMVRMFTVLAVAISTNTVRIAKSKK